MSLGDIFFGLHVEKGTLEVDAKKEAEAAGFAAGAAFSASFSGKLKASASGIVGAGLGLEIGKQMLHGLETAFQDVANVIPGMISEGQAFALNVEQITQKTGASAETASRFVGTLTYLGQSVEGLGMSLKTLSVQVVQNEAQFTKLGIATRDANGNLLDIITILGNVRSYLSTTGDGATKLALATHLLGKSAGNLIEFLNLTDQQAAFLNTMLDNLAVTMGGDAVAAAEGLKREEDLLGLAWQGLSNTLLTAVVPALRQFIGGVIEFVATHGPQLRAMLSDITNTVLGFASALIGVSGVTPFQMQMDALGGTTQNVTVTFEEWAQQMGYTIPKIDKTAGASKAATTAIDRQIKSVDNAAAAEKRRDAVDETIFQRTMKRLSGEYQAQLDALDLAEKQIAIAARRRDLNEQLNQAQLDLAKAQQGSGGKVDAGAVSAAMANIASIQAQQAENERQLAVDTQRARLQAVQSYIEGVAKLEADSDNKKALANTLARRETKLTSELAVAQAAKDATAIADITARLEAVKAAEARTAKAQKSGDKQSELATLKTQLEAQKAAIGAADSATTAAAKRELALRKQQYQAYLDEQQRASELSWEQTGKAVGASIAGDPKTGTGLGGAITKAFSDGQKAGEQFRAFLGTLLETLKSILGTLGDIAGLFPGSKATPPGPSGSPAVNAQTGFTTSAAGFPKDEFQRVNDWANRVTDTLMSGHKWVAKPGDFDPLEQFLGWVGDYFRTPGHLAAMAGGGPVMAGQSYIVGEYRPELFVPETNGWIMPRVPAFAGTTGTLIVEHLSLDLGGTRVIDLIDQKLSYRQRV